VLPYTTYSICGIHVLSHGVPCLWQDEEVNTVLKKYCKEVKTEMSTPLRRKRWWLYRKSDTEKDIQYDDCVPSSWERWGWLSRRILKINVNAVKKVLSWEYSVKEKRISSSLLSGNLSGLFWQEAVADLKGTLAWSFDLSVSFKKKLT
jgi:hypothetical protein